MNSIPKLDEQAKTLLEKRVKPFEFYNAETKEWLSAESPKWKLAVLEKFPQIKSNLQNSAPGQELLPREFALAQDNDAID